MKVRHISVPRNEHLGRELSSFEKRSRRPYKIPPYPKKKKIENTRKTTFSITRCIPIYRPSPSYPFRPKQLFRNIYEKKKIPTGFNPGHNKKKNSNMIEMQTASSCSIASKFCNNWFQGILSTTINRNKNIINQ